MRKNIINTTVLSKSTFLFIFFVFTLFGCAEISNHHNRYWYMIPDGDPKGYVDFYWNRSQPDSSVHITRGKESSPTSDGVHQLPHHDRFDAKHYGPDPRNMRLSNWVNRIEVRPGVHDFTLSQNSTTIKEPLDTIQVEVFEGMITPIEVEYIAYTWSTVEYKLKNVLQPSTYKGPKDIPLAYTPRRLKEMYRSKEAREARKLKKLQWRRQH